MERQETGQCKPKKHAKNTVLIDKLPPLHQIFRIDWVDVDPFCRPHLSSL